MSVEFNFDMSKAPRDATILLLLIAADDSRENPLDDTQVESRTIGFNNFDNDDVDEWRFAGWDWCQDEFTVGKGKPIAWALYPREYREK